MGTAIKAFKAGKKSGEAAGQAMIAGEFGGSLWDLAPEVFKDWALTKVYGEDSKEGREIVRKRTRKDLEDTEEKLRIARRKFKAEEDPKEKEKLEAKIKSLEERRRKLQERERETSNILADADTLDEFIKELKTGLRPSSLKGSRSKIMEALRVHIKETGTKKIEANVAGVRKVFETPSSDPGVVKFFNELAEKFKLAMVLDSAEVEYIQRRTQPDWRRLS